jgi:hypothetical protein
MNFLKKLLDDNSTLIGLSGFSFVKSKQYKTAVQETIFFNPIHQEKFFETNFTKNVLLL